jgi:hypothetical protein
LRLWSKAVVTPTLFHFSGLLHPTGTHTFFPPFSLSCVLLLSLLNPYLSSERKAFLLSDFCWSLFCGLLFVETWKLSIRAKPLRILQACAHTNSDRHWSTFSLAICIRCHEIMRSFAPSSDVGLQKSCLCRQANGYKWLLPSPLGNAFILMPNAYLSPSLPYCLLCSRYCTQHVSKEKIFCGKSKNTSAVVHLVNFRLSDISWSQT